MPKLYEYLGIVIRFFSKEHEPIHIHAFYGEYQLKVELIYKNGKIATIKYKNVKGYKPLPNIQRKELKKFINKYKEDIVKKWIDFFIFKKRIKVKKITRRITVKKSKKSDENNKS